MNTVYVLVDPNWLAIENAPKDGRHILTVVQGNHPSSGKPFVPCVAYWDEGWVTCEHCDLAGTDPDEAYQPTHWMPLPEPPKEQ